MSPAPTSKQRGDVLIRIQIKPATIDSDLDDVQNATIPQRPEYSAAPAINALVKRSKLPPISANLTPTKRWTD